MEEIDNQLSKVISKALEVATTTGEFVIDQAPDVLNEFYKWHIAQNILGIFLAIGLILLAFNIRKLWGRRVEKDYEPDWDEVVINGWASESGATYISLIVLNLIGFIMLFTCIYSLIFIIVAPKIYLIEYFLK